MTCPKEENIVEVARTNTDGKEFKMTVVPPTFQPTEQPATKLVTDANPRIQGCKLFYLFNFSL